MDIYIYILDVYIYIYARKSEEKETPYHCHEKRENKMT